MGKLGDSPGLRQASPASVVEAAPSGLNFGQRSWIRPVLRGVMADRKFRVVVAGAGVSGLFMAETLKRAGIDFTVYEKAGEVGGTWRDNTFPGLFVDVLSRQYEFPFQPNYDWSRKYAPAAEIWAYIKKVARDRGLTRFIRFDEEVAAARFTEGRWHIETAAGRTDVADVFVCATGFLHKPLLPD